MIRPITLICFAAACGSGLYLYQEKHRVQVLDQQIEQTVHQTEQTRAQMRMLHAEWTLLNDPDRLRQLAGQFLPTLQPVSPTQYTDMADLDSRLPAVPPPPPPAPPAAPDSGAPVAQAEPPPATQAVEPDHVVASAHAAQSAQPAAPAPKLAEVPTPQRPPAPRPAPSHTAVAQVHPSETHVDPRPHDTRYDPRVAERDRRVREARVGQRQQQFRPESRPVLQRPMVAEMAPVRYARPVMPQPRPYTGSLLGMAQGRPGVPPPVPLPRPMPVSGYPTYGAGGG